MRDFTNDKIKNIKPSGIRKFFDIARSVEGVISLGVGEPDFDTPFNIRSEGIYAIEKGYTFYSSNAGLLELREAICKFLHDYHKVSYNPDDVIVTIGASEGIDLVCRACLEKDDEVIVINPGYVSYIPCVILANAKPVFYNLEETDNYKIKADKLEKLITNKTKMIILNYPNNPTGAIMTGDDILSIKDVIIKHDLLLVSDEIYSELTYDTTHTSFASIDELKERTILLNGFSKAYSMTGWRLGYVCGPKDIIKQMLKIHQYTIMCAPTISQYAALEAISNSYDSVLNMKEEYKLRRNYCFNRLNSMGLNCYMPEGAFYIFANIKKYGMTSEDFCLKLLNDAKVVVVPGDAFGDNGEGYIRISYAYSIEDLKNAFDRIEEFLKLM